MRILHVVPTYWPAIRYGGPIYSVHGLCKGLVQLGHQVHVGTTSVDGPGDSDVPHGIPVDRDGVQVHYFRSPALRRLYWSPGLQRWLGTVMGGYDVVHLHSVFLWPTSMAARLAVARSIPYVLSPRGTLVPELILRKSALPKLAWIAAFEARTLARASCVHWTSEHERRAAERLPLLRLPEGFVVPNGIDLDEVPGDPQPSDAPYAVYLGRINWEKGIDRAIRAVRGTPIRLRIYGNDRENHVAYLQALADELGVASQVAFMGPVSGDAKWRALAGARLTVLPSLSENFGNVVVESMAVGVPVVATEGVGAATVLRAAEAGRVCPGDEAALRSAMLDLWDQPQLARSLGDAGRDYVHQYLSWKAVARTMAAHYDLLVGSC
ncbi:MAG: glycosyltransferase [Myxococcales bacterium]|nr:glycosyltransferase [Myxococcales bacterium]